MHYHSEAEIQEKWQRRLQRLDKSNMIVKFSDSNGCCQELVNRFEALPFKNKICFTAKPYEGEHVIVMPEYKDKEHVLYEWAYSYRYYDFVKEANGIKWRNNVIAV